MDTYETAALLGLPAIGNLSPRESLRMHGTLATAEQELAVDVLEALNLLEAADEALGEALDTLMALIPTTKGETRTELCEAVQKLTEAQTAFSGFLTAVEGE